MVHLKFDQLATLIRRISYAMLVCGLVAVLVDVYGGDGTGAIQKMIAKFDLNSKSGIPTWFSTCILLLAGYLALLASGMLSAAPARQTKPAPERFYLQWLLLACIMAALSIDEIAGLHHALSGPFRRFCLALFGVYHPSFNPAIALAPIFALLFIPFLLRLPQRLGLHLAIAGLIYLFGALGLEWIGAGFARDYGKDADFITLLRFLEECAELMGIVYFIHIVCRHLQPSEYENLEAATPPADTLTDRQSPQRLNAGTPLFAK